MTDVSPVTKRDFVKKYLSDEDFLNFLKKKGVGSYHDEADLYHHAVEYYTLKYPVPDNGNLSI